MDIHTDMHTHLYGSIYVSIYLSTHVSVYLDGAAEQGPAPTPRVVGWCIAVWVGTCPCPCAGRWRFSPLNGNGVIPCGWVGGWVQVTVAVSTAETSR